MQTGGRGAHWSRLSLGGRVIRVTRIDDIVLCCAVLCCVVLCGNDFAHSNAIVPGMTAPVAMKLLMCD